MVIQSTVTLANPNRGVSIKKDSVPISEFVRISEVIHRYGEFCSESLLDITESSLIRTSLIRTKHYYSESLNERGQVDLVDMQTNKQRR